MDIIYRAKARANGWWLEYLHCSNDSVVLQNATFQTVLLTDGTHSYVTYLYDVIHPEAPFLTGFNAGNRQGGVVIAGSEPHFNLELQTMSFRTDGMFFIERLSSIQKSTDTVEPLNRGHTGSLGSVLYREAVLYSEVE